MQLDAVEKRFCGGGGGVNMNLLEDKERRRAMASELLLLLFVFVCVLECRMSRFILPDEKLHNWHLYCCCCCSCWDEAPPPDALILAPNIGDGVVELLKMRTSCSLVGRNGVNCLLVICEGEPLGVTEEAAAAAVAVRLPPMAAFFSGLLLKISAQRFEEEVCLAGFSTAGSLMMSGLPLVRRSAVATSAGNISMYLWLAWYRSRPFRMKSRRRSLR